MKMQVSSNINSLLQLEKKLEESTKKLANLNNLDSDGTNTNEQKSTNKNSVEILEKKDIKDDSDNIEDVLDKTPMPLAYSFDSNVVSVYNSAAKTILDIKV